MLIAILSDTHAGAKSDNPVVQDYFGKFFDKVFFPELKKRNITTIIHGGDVFDRRKYINYQTLSKVNSYFLDKIGDLGMTMHVIPGNHDCFYKTTNELNSLKELLSNKKGIHVYEEPTDLVFDSLKIHMLPWLSPENRSEFMKRVNASHADWMIGHLELVGFDMHKGQPCEHGDDSKSFSKFERVLTGHFHTQSMKDNIQYLGSPYEMTWIDHQDPKGFHILDTETRTLEFVQNPFSLHEKIYYNDTTNTYTNESFSYCKDKVVKLIVEKKNNHAVFDKVVDAINNVGPLNFTIVEDMQLLVAESDEAVKDVDKDTITLIDEYIDDIQNNVDKVRLKSIMKNLYNEAQQ